MKRTSFGVTAGGEPVERIVLDSGRARCSILTYGGALASLVVPDRNGNPTESLPSRVLFGNTILPRRAQPPVVSPAHPPRRRTMEAHDRVPVQSINSSSEYGPLAEVFVVKGPPFYKAYGDLLQRTIIPPGESYIDYCQPLSDMVKKNLPTRLFRFRVCNENNIDAFRTNRIYFNTSNNFNDPHDCLVYINYEKIKAEIESVDIDFLFKASKT